MTWLILDTYAAKGKQGVDEERRAKTPLCRIVHIRVHGCKILFEYRSVYNTFVTVIPSPEKGQEVVQKRIA